MIAFFRSLSTELLIGTIKRAGLLGACAGAVAVKDMKMTKVASFLAIALVLAGAPATPAAAAGSPGFSSTHSLGSTTRTTTG
jgi:cytochrome c oxidase assembly factor CtaG